MEEPRFAITGSGRSGTKYVSKLLRACGINCGHEEWWGIHTEPQPGLDGDASFLATFDTSFKGFRFAQVRNPIDTIPSIATGLFKDKAYLDLHKHVMSFTGNRMLDATVLWTRYTRRAVFYADLWWRLEDLDEGVIERLTDTVRLKPHGVSEAFERVSKWTNARPKKNFAWPDTREVEEAFIFARDLGYDV